MESFTLKPEESIVDIELFNEIVSGLLDGSLEHADLVVLIESLISERMEPLLQRLKVLEERDKTREEWQRKTKEDFARIKSMLGDLEGKMGDKPAMTKEFNKLGDAVKQGEKQMKQGKGVVDLWRNFKYQLRK